jgi:hypothetical protein
MFWDIAIVAGISATQLIVTIYAVWVSVTEHKLKIAGVIGLIGGIGIAITVWGAVRSISASTDLTTKIAQVKELQTQLDNKVTIIEQNTSKPPVINFPAAPIPKAYMVLAKMESALVQLSTGARVLMEVGKPVALNYHFINIGQAEAHNNKIYIGIYIVPRAESVHADPLIARFKKEAKASMDRGIGASVPPGGRTDAWNTGMLDRNIEAADIQKLNSGEEIMILFFTDTYSDAAGPHHLHYCSAVQPPPAGGTFSLDALHNCAKYNDNK